ncbi:PKD domain-containing protein [Lentzea sp. NPDC051213]|uniref:PKD domain-containing protein n=1 Tax=Lentzea sp. NPDC051213 TaxID=3364126 RepID=UPI0037B996A3
MSTRLRISALVAAMVAVLLPGVAHAATAGDDFDSAIEITALPLTTTIDTTGATEAADDPQSCFRQGENTVWLKYTAPADGLLRVSARSGRWGPFLAGYTGQRGALTEEPGTCTEYGGYNKTVHAKAGVTYRFLLVDHYPGWGGPVEFRLDNAAPETNDSRAAATVTGLPAEHQGDLSLATAEPGEVPPSCDTAATRSVWYRYTPAHARFVNVTTERAAMSVHRASDLSEVDCVRSGGGYQGAVFSAAAGETYLIRVADVPEESRYFWVKLGTAAAISPRTSASPAPASVYRDVSFNTWAGDPIGRPLVSGTVDLGDGTTYPAATERFQHRYAKDGEYRITTTGATADGRSGSTVTTLKVETHDVTLAGLSAPATARAGQTKQLKVSVANARYDENVKVTLYRAGPDGYEQEVGHLTQRVPVGRTDFPFAYTYSAEDAATGKATFRAVAVVTDWDRTDANPDDNQARAATTVRPASASGAS